MYDFKEIVRLITSENDDEVIKKNVADHIKKLISGIKNFEVLFLCRSTGMIDDFDSDRIYNRLPNGGTKNIMMVINSSGGRIEPAYLISKCCKENAKEKFVVSIPRRAKSAATLISLGADEIHMGPLSEIGPIDPQMEGLPALSLRSALEHLAFLCKKCPESSAMLAEYLAKTLPLSVLGYCERISESAEYYAIRLLQNKKLTRSAEKIAHKLVYEYKDHAFVIGKDESIELFGNKFIKVGTDEYTTGNKVYSFLDSVNLVYRWRKNKTFNLIGSSEDLVSLNIQQSY